MDDIGGAILMGLKRSFHRRQERQASAVIRRQFAPFRASTSVTCDACGREVTIEFPAVPKRGAQLTVRKACECGNVIAATLRGQRSVDSPGDK